MQSRVNLHIDFPDMDVEDCVEVGRRRMDHRLTPPESVG